MWCLATPKIGEREVLAALLDHDHHLLREGQILLADKGFAGKDFQELAAAMGVRLLRPPGSRNACWPWPPVSGTTG